MTQTRILGTVKKLFLSGIGGVSMCALAEVLAEKGYEVRGSDMSESSAVARLRSKGIDVVIGHDASNTAGCDAVIRSAAIKDSNPEIAAAIAAGLPIIERAQAWGVIMGHYTEALCIAGTHGKTTTTGMAAHVAMAAGLDPTIMLGGMLPAIGAGHKLGADNIIIAESCEYCNSFLHFCPTLAVILNVEADHLDFFTGLDEIITSFAAFAAKAKHVVVNGEDANAMAAVLGMKHTTFGTEPEYDVHCKELTFQRGLPCFEIWAYGEFYADVRLQVPGRHNVLNALAVAAAARHLNISGAALKSGLESFIGTGRRFERIGTYNGADIVDDYAHHPTEVAATLNAAKEMGYRRVVLAFQPHTYSRTAALFDEFAEALSGADKLMITEIYAAREQSTGLSAETLSKAVSGAEFYATLDELEQAMKETAAEGDLIITMGAGSISDVGRKIIGR